LMECPEERDEYNNSGQTCRDPFRQRGGTLE
jgi:hypothetical protein